MVGQIRSWLSWIFLVAAILLHVVLLSSLWTGLLNSLFFSSKYLLGQGADFFAFYQAGNNVLNDISCYIRPETLAVPYMYRYRYLAYFAYSFGVILNIVPPLVAYWLWIAILILLVWLAAIRTRFIAESMNRPSWEGRIAMAMWFIFTPIYIELYMGQVTMIAGILLYFALTTPMFVSGEDGNKMTIAAWILSGLIKLIPFLMAPVMLFAGKIRTVLIAIFVMILAILIVPTGLESFQTFLNFNSARNMQIRPYPGNHSLKELLFFLLGEPSGIGRTLTLLLMGIFFLLAGIATLYSRDVWACACLFLTTYFLTMSDVWDHHYTFLLPLMVLMWIRGQPRDKARWIPVVLVLVMSIPMMPIVAFLSGSGSSVHPKMWSTIWQIIYHSSKALPALIFFLWLLVIAFQSPRQERYLKSIKSAFQNAWDGLVKGETPLIRNGILIPPVVPIVSPENEVTREKHQDMPV